MELQVRLYLAPTKELLFLLVLHTRIYLPVRCAFTCTTPTSSTARAKLFYHFTGNYNARHPSQS